MRKHILLSSIIASSALAVTAYGQIINGNFANGLNGWDVTGSTALIPTRPFDAVTVSGLGTASVVNGDTALISTNGVTVTRLSQTFTVPGRAAVRARFGEVGRLRLSNYRGYTPKIQLAFNYQFLTNEGPGAVFDFSQIKLGNTQLVFNTPADTAPPGAFGFTNATPVQLVTTDISALQGKNTTLSFTVADTIDAIVDSGTAIWDVKILPYVLEDIDSIASVYSSGLPMALAQRGILLNAVQNANRDVNARLFRLRTEIADAGATGPSGHHGLSKDGKSSKDSKKTILPPEEPRWEAFASGGYGYRDVEAIGQTAGFATDLYSGTIGIEYALCPKGNVHVGLAATYLEADNDIGLGVGDVEIEGYTFSAYASFTKDAFYADLLYSFGTFHHNIARDTGLGTTATAQPDSRSHTVQFNTGYNFYYGSFVTGPLAGIDYVNGSIDGYKEDRSASASVKVGEQNFDSLVSRIGWQISRPTQTRLGLLTPQIRAAWVHEYMNDEKQITANLNNSPFYLVNGGSISRIGGFSETGSTAEPGDDYLSLGAGISLQISDRAALLLDYETRLLQADSTAHSVSLTGSVRF